MRLCRPDDGIIVRVEELLAGSAQRGRNIIGAKQRHVPPDVGGGNVLSVSRKAAVKTVERRAGVDAGHRAEYQTELLQQRAGCHIPQHHEALMSATQHHAVKHGMRPHSNNLASVARQFVQLPVRAGVPDDKGAGGGAGAVLRTHNVLVVARPRAECERCKRLAGQISKLQPRILAKRRDHGPAAAVHAARCESRRKPQPQDMSSAVLAWLNWTASMPCTDGQAADTSSMGRAMRYTSTRALDLPSA